MGNINTEKNIHAGHRQRLKAAMREHGLEPYNDIQVLEALLFYAIPNGDTNPTAHRLLEQFGSFHAVLEADFDELRKVKGIGENAASLICFMKQICGYYFKSKNSEISKRVQMESYEDLCKYFERAFVDEKYEQIRVMGLDDRLYMMCEEVISEGDFGRVEVSVKKLAEFCFKNCCNRIVISHNHPNGVALPSAADISLTKDIVELLDELEIELLDHIIVGRGGSYSMRNSQQAFKVWDL